MHKLRGRFRYFPARAFLQAKELSGDLAGLFRKASVVGGWRATPPGRLHRRLRAAEQADGIHMLASPALDPRGRLSAGTILVIRRKDR